MTCPIQQFTITPEQYAKLQTEAQNAGVPVVGDSGSASKYGVQVQWNYADPELHIQVLHVPFFMSADTVEAKIVTLVNAVKV